jgi:hypothetical protein
MASEKYIDNVVRPLDIEDAQFLNVKSEPDVDTPLPSPVSTPLPSSSKPKSKLTTSFIIPVWIVLSSTVIIYNNYLYNTLEFKFPVFLVTWHLGFAVRQPYVPPVIFSTTQISFISFFVFSQAIGTRVLQRTTHLLDGAKDVHLTKDMFVRSILPIGLLFSASLILSNTAYLYLSVAYIQMLKVPFFSYRLAPFILTIIDLRLGIHSRCNPLHLLVIPYPGTQPQTRRYRLYDLIRSCSCFTW